MSFFVWKLLIAACEINYRFSIWRFDSSITVVQFDRKHLGLIQDLYAPAAVLIALQQSYYTSKTPKKTYF